MSFSHSGLLKTWLLKAVLGLKSRILFQPFGWAGRSWLSSSPFIGSESRAGIWGVRGTLAVAGLGSPFVWQGEGSPFTPFLCCVAFHHAVSQYSSDPHVRNLGILANAISSYDFILINDTWRAKGSPCRCCIGVLPKEHCSQGWFVLVLEMKWCITGKCSNPKKMPLA